MLLSEAKEILKKNGYRLVEDTDDWDEADLGVDSYADKKRVLRNHNIGKQAGWHFRDLHSKVNHASYEGGHAAEDKILDAFRAEFDEVTVNKNREWGVKGKIVHNGVKCNFELTSCYNFVSPANKNKEKQFVSHSEMVRMDIDNGDMITDIDTTKQNEINDALDEILNYIANKA